LPRYSLPAEFINNFINNLPVLVLGKAYGAATVGHFNMSNRMLGMPVQLVSASVSEVFRQRASTEFREHGQCERFFKKTFWSLAGLSILPFAILFFFGPQLFSFFLGGNWLEAGVYSGILAPVFFLRFTVSPLTYMFFVAGKQREDFIMHVVMLMAVFASLWIAAANAQNVLITLIAYSAIYCLIYMYYLARSFTFAKGIV
jgi:O-antigen/teichoic acid export membrane protein